MGTWSTGLFGNDTTCDVRDTYIQFLKQQFSNEDAYQSTYEEFEELMGTEEEPLFWYALAETQWNVGRLTPAVRDVALRFIQENGGLSLWEDSITGRKKWEIILQKLEEKLKSQMLPEKKYRKPVEFEKNPWNVGDIYAYEFHTQKAVEKDMEGKYILLQKIGNVEYYKGVTFSVIQVFNQIYDALPQLDSIGNLTILPLVYSPIEKDSLGDMERFIPSFEYYTAAIMLYEKKNDYPKRYLTFVGNLSIPEREYECNCFTDFYWEKNELDDWLIDYYLSWLAYKTVNQRNT